MSNLIDLRKYNIKNEDDALEFLSLIEAKLPQLQKVLKSNRLKLASAINRAEFAENKSQPTQNVQAEGEYSVGERITGRVPLQSSRQAVAQSRIEQLRAAQSTPKAPVMTTEDNDDPLDLPEAVSDGPVGPGQIGRIPVASNGPVDLAAMAAAQSEEDIAAEAGISPSAHAIDDGVQQEDPSAENVEAEIDPTDPAALNLLPDDTVGVGDRVAREQSKSQG